MYEYLCPRCFGGIEGSATVSQESAGTVRDSLWRHGTGAAVSRRSWPLDALRVFAALVVVCQHWGPYGLGDLAGPGAPSMLMRYGFMGVDVFFFISGVVITRSAVGRHPRDFVVARFARLAPAYLLILGATIAVGILVSDPRLSFESALSSLTFSEYVTGTESGGLLILDSWTLWVEIQFYLLIALFLLAGLLLPRKSQRRSFPSLSQLRVVYLVWLALLAMALANVQEIPGLLTLAGYASIFLCGALFGTVVSWRDALRMSPILLLATTMMLFRFLERASGAAIEPTDFGGALAPTLVGVGLVLLCVAAALGSLSARPLPVRLAKVLTLCALATYPLYLMHQELGNRLVIWLQGTGGLAAPLALIIAFAVVVALSLFISSRLEPVARRWIVATWRPTPAQPEQESPVSPKG